MTDLFRLLTAEMVDRYELETIVETGLSNGTGCLYAQTLPFKKIFSIEFYERKIETAQLAGIADDSRVTLICADAPVGIGEILSKLQGNVCWWLDAHSPREKDDPDRRFPLQRELTVITQGRDIQNDLFIVDDGILYDGFMELIKSKLDETHDVRFVQPSDLCAAVKNPVVAFPRLQ